MPAIYDLIGMYKEICYDRNIQSGTNILGRQSATDEIRRYAEEYIRMQYIKKRSGLSGKQILEDNDLIVLKENINALATTLRFSKNQLRQFLSSTRQSLRSNQTSRLREARKTNGMKPRNLHSKATSGSSIYSLPKAIKSWKR